MYCIECGELTTRDRWGNLIHEYALHDNHPPILEATMAMETPCQTSGAQFHIHVSPTGVSVAVDFGFYLPMSEDEAKLIEANLHNATELALAPLYVD